MRDRDLAGTVKEAQERLDKKLTGLPKGYYIEWSGQYESLIRSERTLMWILPVVLLIIFGAMYFAFHSARGSVLFAGVDPLCADRRGGHDLCVGSESFCRGGGGFIALFGLAVETGS